MRFILLRHVLILVLVEVVLGADYFIGLSSNFAIVLILVLVEVVLGVLQAPPLVYPAICLNPCFSGSCSWRR